MAAAKADKKEEPKWDETFEPVMKVILGKKALKVKSASEVGKKKVDYFRGKDFKKYLLENPSILKKKCAAALEAALPEGGVPETEKDVDAIGDELIARNFCYKAVYKPLNPKEGDKTVKKWPDRLAKDPRQKFDCEGFYVVTYEGAGGMRSFLLGLIIAGVLLACLFPVWPFWAKVGVWYVSVLFLSLYFGILIWRLVIYALFWVVGFDFWIFPNINDETIGFLETFQPFYSWDKRKDDAMMLLVRFVGLPIIAVAVQQIAETHSLADVQDFVVSSYVDVLDWGVDKLTAALPSAEKMALPSFEDLQNSTDFDDDNATDGAEKLSDNADDDDDAAETVEQ